MTCLWGWAAGRADRVLGDATPRANSGERHVEERRIHLAGDLVRAWLEIERMNSSRGHGRALERGAERAVSREIDIDLHPLVARSGRRPSAAPPADGQEQERQAACGGFHDR